MATLDTDFELRHCHSRSNDQQFIGGSVAVFAVPFFQMKTNCLSHGFFFYSNASTAISVFVVVI